MIDLWHAITCPVRRRWRRWRFGQPMWADDPIAQWLGVARFGCRRCGRNAIKERDKAAAASADPTPTDGRE